MCTRQDDTSENTCTIHSYNIRPTKKLRFSEDERMSCKIATAVQILSSFCFIEHTMNKLCGLQVTNLFLVTKMAYKIQNKIMYDQETTQSRQSPEIITKEKTVKLRKFEINLVNPNSDGLEVL